MLTDSKEGMRLQQRNEVDDAKKIVDKRRCNSFCEEFKINPHIIEK